MKYLAIPLMLCITGWCNAQSSDVESDRGQRAESDRRALEWQREQDQRSLQHPILRYPENRSPGTSSSQLLAQAEALEREGRGTEAVRLYVRAARAGSGRAAKRLAEIYDKGIEGVPRDFAESLKWNSYARSLGDDAGKGSREQEDKAAAKRGEGRFYNEPDRAPGPEVKKYEQRR